MNTNWKNSKVKRLELLSYKQERYLRSVLDLFGRMNPHQKIYLDGADYLITGVIDAIEEVLEEGGYSRNEAEWMNDLKLHYLSIKYGAEELLARMLSENISKEIDKEILNRLKSGYIK